MRNERRTSIRQSITALALALLVASAGLTAQTGTVMPVPKAQFFDNVGDPCSGCKLEAFAAGTSTPQNTFADAALTTANLNPVILDGAGRATVYLHPTQAYKFVLKTALDVVLWTVDNVHPAESGVVLSGAIPHSLIPSATNTFDLGSTGVRWKDLFLSGSVTATGSATIGGAVSIGTTLSVTGGQITFPAAQAPSVGVNVLDDYEEGTFTPTIGGSGGQSGQVYAANGQVGRYIKIGKLVHAQGFVALTTLGTVTGNVQIQGLPFAAANAANAFASGSIGAWLNFTTSITWLGCFITANTSACELRMTTAAAATAATVAQANLANTTQILFSVTYEATQ